MFDEPSLGLAPNIVEQVSAIVDEIRKSGTTSLMVEQNAYCALEMCDHAYLAGDRRHARPRRLSRRLIRTARPPA